MQLFREALNEWLQRSQLALKVRANPGRSHSVGYGYLTLYKAVLRLRQWRRGVALSPLTQVENGYPTLFRPGEGERGRGRGLWPRLSYTIASYKLALKQPLPHTRNLHLLHLIEEKRWCHKSMLIDVNSPWFCSCEFLCRPNRLCYSCHSDPTGCCCNHCSWWDGHNVSTHLLQSVVSRRGQDSLVG